MPRNMAFVDVVRWLLVLLLLHVPCVVVCSRVEDTWTLLPWSEEAECAPVVLSATLSSSATRRGIPRNDDKAADITLLRVYTLYSDNIEPLVWNLVESLLAAFPASLVGGARRENRRRYPAPFDQCQWALRNGSLEHWEYSFVSLAFPFDGLCVGALREDHDISKRNSGGVADGQTAPFQSSAYYYYLKRKLSAFAARVEADFVMQQHSVEVNNAALSYDVSPWALLLDSDVQVFPGFFEVVAAKVACPYFTLQCKHIRYGGGCEVASVLPSKELRDSSEDAATQPTDDSLLTVQGYFQRENRKLINTGVVLLDTSSAGSRCLYREALRLFSPAKYGDQTAIQRVLKRRRGFCVEGSGAASHLFVHEVFHRLHVNGNFLDGNLLVAHHAHMSGSAKLSALEDVLQKIRVNRYSDQAAWRPSARGSSVHSGVFLRTPTATLRDDRLARRCQIQDSNSRLVSPLLRNLICNVISAARQQHHPGPRGDLLLPSAASRHLFQLRTPTATSNNYSVPIATTVFSNNTRPAKGKKLKSKVIWTALPALLVIITLTVYHYYVSLRPGNPDYDVVEMGERPPGSAA